jgi:hypothetical protein
LSLDRDVSKSLREAIRAWDLFEAGINAYGAAIIRREWKAAEAERPKIEAALDVYLDAMAAAQRRIELESRKDAE